MFNLKSQLSAIKAGKPGNIAKMYPTNYQDIFDNLHKYGLIDNWPGNVDDIILSQKGEAILKTIR